MTKRKLALLLIFPTIIVVNIVSIIAVSLIFHDSDASGKIGLFSPALFQIFWLTIIAFYSGFDVLGPSEVIPSPNVLGWFLALISSLATFVAYYLLSSTIAGLWLKYRYRKM
ncbi:MAG: hypothetical protein IPK84_04840 [Candidatus Moraniibacteriota bacterium]|nr:MAG: hypothetical protein IPK84_04840 [Candidatus Moranbacteria bacterium]